MGTVYEWYGYLAADTSAAAQASASNQHCPFLNGQCQKAGGVCSVEPAPGQRVAVCPIRMYFGGHLVLREIAAEAFEPFAPVVNAADGLPELIDGDRVKAAAAAAGQPYVGVFGKGWGGEIKLPPAPPAGARYSIDFVLVLVDSAGNLLGIVPIEVQTIDTTGSYKDSVAALAAGRHVVSSKFGMNWENVNKRILPQLIVKGLMLQAERLCANGIFFLSPATVYDRIMNRLGGQARFREIPRQPGSITFVRLDYGPPPAAGSPAALVQSPYWTISTSDLSLAFITPENLPPAGSYEAMVRKRL